MKDKPFFGKGPGKNAKFSKDKYGVWKSTLLKKEDHEFAYHEIQKTQQEFEAQLEIKISFIDEQIILTGS